MGNFIQLPDERLFLVNGVGKGSAGYGWDDWAINQSYAADPVLSPAYYNGSAPAGSRFDTDLPASTIGRLYHSSATLLPDGESIVPFMVELTVCRARSSGSLTPSCCASQAPSLLLARTPTLT